MITKKSKILIIGAGILGLSVARELVKRGKSDILIIEKESALGAHASGRNSGVLHAGVYYPPDTLKAKLCLKGNSLLRAYCRDHHLPLLDCGKVLVAKNEKELKALDLIYERGKGNGARVSYLGEDELEKIEPLATTYEKAVLSKDTAVVDPNSILAQLKTELEASKRVFFSFDTSYIKRLNEHTILTSNGELVFEFMINAAGSFADKIAHQFGVGKHYRLIPFKGLYKKLIPEKAKQMYHHIYPVPDLENPFLGVHFTKSTSGDVYVGPTAIPAFGAENYSGAPSLNKEAVKIALSDAILFLKNPKFRKVALTEPKRYLDYYFFKEAQQLVPGLKMSDIVPSSKVGIRPQLVNWESKELVMDFCIEAASHHIHILNAISPAFTSAFAFSEYVIDKYFPS
ncbi:L-2-hydroxyglutarate oxidase [Candidatus Marinamargulisbacteria bacterium SCGC AG-439-L15]|nr:L-2-hydroxyglutarate oxidase [Candidatus Marinamargulisbacteria bacterium SCGC AG-439-L15]